MAKVWKVLRGVGLAVAGIVALAMAGMILMTRWQRKNGQPVKARS